MDSNLLSGSKYTPVKYPISGLEKRYMKPKTKNVISAMTITLLLTFSACSSKDSESKDYQSCIKGHWYYDFLGYYAELVINDKYVSGINEESLLESSVPYKIEGNKLIYLEGQENNTEVLIKTCDFEKLIAYDQVKVDTFYRYDYSKVFFHPEARKNYMQIDLEGEFFFRSAFYKENLKDKE